MIGIRSAFSIRARGHWPHLEAVYMTAPRSVCENTKKSLADRGPSIHDVKAHLHDLAARARVLLGMSCPLKHQRAQGMPGARCARSLACKNKKAYERSHHGHTGYTPHSARNGFNGFLRALPGDRAWLPPSL